MRPRSALIGGVAVGTTVTALAAGIWWSGAPDRSGCPRSLARAAPFTLDDAAALVAACGTEDLRLRLRTLPLSDVLSYRSAALPPAAWIAQDSPLHRHLTAVGFAFPDDMSFAVLSAAWHRTRGLPFEAKATAECLHAWNRKMRLWVESVAPGSTVPAPEFGCASIEEIDKGRPLWPKE